MKCAVRCLKTVTRYTAVLVEIDEKWASDTKAYIKWECQDA